MPLMGNGEGYTLLILTDAESRLLREVLEHNERILWPSDARKDALKAYRAGIARGTAKLAEEFKGEQARKKAAKK